MPLVVSGISLPFEQPEGQAVEQAVSAVKDCRVKRAHLAKKSVDARRKQDIRFVYTVELELEEDETAVAAKLRRPDVTVRAREPLAVQRGGEKLGGRPVVVGFGPAGMFAALLLAREGMRPVVLEQGADIDTRVAQVEGFWSTGALNRQSNVQFGEGGAGAFSDGKLTTRIGDPRCRYVLEQLAAHGAPEEILYQAKPHIGTDRLRSVVKSVRQEIVRLGGEVRFGSCVRSLSLRDTGGLQGVVTGEGTVESRAVVLAPGHSARSLFEQLLLQGVDIRPKPFSVGVRMEHLQRDIDIALYGDAAGNPLLPKGEYQLSHREGARAVYTFCMCPGGVVVPATSEEGMVVTNGMSEYARIGRNANAALAVSVDPADYGRGPLDGIEFQRRLETAAYMAGGGGYMAPAQTVGRFLRGESGLKLDRVNPSYTRGVAGADFSALLPDFVVDLLRDGLRRFERKMRGFAADDVVLTGIETRTSSPVRLQRGDDLQAVAIPGLYPCGEGAGYAGGIVSAAVDGIRAAQALLLRYGA